MSKFLPTFFVTRLRRHRMVNGMCRLTYICIRYELILSCSFVTWQTRASVQ